jgi:hypothetical protein
VKPNIEVVGPEVETGPGNCRRPTNKPHIAVQGRIKKAETIHPQTKHETGSTGIGNNNISNLGAIGFSFGEEALLDDTNARG